MRPKAIIADKFPYLPIKSYKEGVNCLELFTKMILFSFAKHPEVIKEVVIRNFIARAVIALKGIMKLWEIEDYFDCWVIHRCILDRLFHLNALAKDNAFELFEKWSFKQQYEARNKIRSDPELKGKLSSDFLKYMELDKKRYVIISKERPKWERPRARKIATEMDLEFFYKFGYNYASTLVHPMANDGEEDFYRQTKLLGKDFFVDHRAVINNSCLAVAILINEALNYSDLNWRRMVYDFLGNFMVFLENGSKEYLKSFYKISSLFPKADLCKKTNKKRTEQR